MKIFVHTDLDGRACGAILARRHKKNGKLAEVSFYNYFYRPENSILLAKPDEEIIFADITPKLEDLQRLMKITKNITIIDHHTSSIKDLKQIDFKFPGIQIEDGLGACVLTWKYFCKEFNTMPRGLTWIAEYDAWERTTTNKEFVTGMSRYITYPVSTIWDKILADDDGFITEILRHGKEYLSYLTPWYKRLSNNYSIPGFVNDDSGDPTKRLTAVFLNQASVDSSVFDELKRPFDVYFRGVFGKNQVWLVTVTTNRNDIDLSEFARKFGGGGHRKNAGFAADDIYDFFLPEVKKTLKER